MAVHEAIAVGWSLLEVCAERSAYAHAVCSNDTLCRARRTHDRRSDDADDCEREFTFGRRPTSAVSCGGALLSIIEQYIDGQARPQ